MDHWRWMSEHIGWAGPGTELLALVLWLAMLAGLIAVGLFIVRVTRRPPPRNR